MAMAEGCLHYLLYLNQKLPITKNLVEQHPLSLYATKYWPLHAKAIDHMPCLTVTKLALKMLMNGDIGLPPWVQLCNIDRPPPKSSKKIQKLSPTTNVVAQPLYYAASTGLVQVVENVLLQEVDVNDKGGDHDTALGVACFNGHEKIVRILLDAGAEISDMLLFKACHGGNEKVVQMLLDAGADINAGGPNNSILQSACYYGNKEVVQLLIDAGADVNAGRSDRSILWSACYYGYLEVVQLLIDAGADINAGGPNDSILQSACSDGNKEVVQILLDAGADISTQGPYENALWRARLNGHSEVVEILLKKKAEIKQRQRAVKLEEKNKKRLKKHSR